MNNREAFEAACELLPEGVTWGEPITPSIAKHIAALASQQQDHIPDGGKMVQQTESQWISVEERLPEMAQKVFGIYDAGMCAFMRVRSEDDTWRWAIGRNDLYDDFFYDVDDDYQVTHWMPLPLAPDGDKP